MRYNPLMNANILIVDDEQDILDLLSMNLTAEGYTTATARTGAEALQAVETNPPDAILLDIMLGDMSGIAITGKLKNDPQTSHIPIIMLTAKDTDTDMIVGLKVGADDYITKPFSTQILTARIEAVLRRVNMQTQRAAKVLTAGNVKIITNSRQVKVDGVDVNLTSLEYDILHIIFKAAGDIVSRKDLKDALGSQATSQKDRIVDVHIAAIRKKLAKGRKVIKTMHGRGYRLNA